GGFSLPYDGVNKREGGGGNQMNRPPLPRATIFPTLNYDFARFGTLAGSGSHANGAWFRREPAAYLFGKAMPAGFDPHIQKLVGSNPNWRGRCVASSSISSTPTEYSKIMPSGPLK